MKVQFPKTGAKGWMGSNKKQFSCVNQVKRCPTTFPRQGRAARGLRAKSAVRVHGVHQTAPGGHCSAIQRVKEQQQPKASGYLHSQHRGAPLFKKLLWAETRHQPGTDDGFLRMEKDQPRGEASKLKAGNFSGGLFIDYESRNAAHITTYLQTLW